MKKMLDVVVGGIVRRDLMVVQEVVTLYLDEYHDVLTEVEFEALEQALLSIVRYFKDDTNIKEDNVVFGYTTMENLKWLYYGLDSYYGQTYCYMDWDEVRELERIMHRIARYIICRR